MARIVGVNSVNYIDKRKLESKLSFREGEKFFAKICTTDKKTGEVTLKLPNGWEFKADIDDNSIKDNLEFMEGKIVKFQVTDFSNGKLQLSIPEEITNEELTSSLKNILQKLNLESSDENIELLSKMIKHDIPLTKDNIYIFKNTMFIKQRIEQSNDESDALARLFLLKCNIDDNAPESQFIKENLKEFFNALKSTNNDILLSLNENGLDIFSKDNIDSMKALNDGSNVFEKSIRELLATFKDGLSTIDLGNNITAIDKGKNIQAMNNNNQLISDRPDLCETEDGVIIKKQIGKPIEKSIEKSIEKIIDRPIETPIKKIIDKPIDKSINKSIDKSINKSINISTNDARIQDKGRLLSSEKLQELSRAINGDDKLRDDIIKQLNLQKEFGVNDKKLLSKSLSTEDIRKLVVDDFTKKVLLGSIKVREDIGDKINDLKNLIKDVMDLKQKLDPALQKELMQSIKGSVNNLKVLNSLTDQYYYLDSPLKYKNKEHEFKLIIKNNNKNKHEFDTKCVKIFASIKTVHMGFVDNFININNNNMQVKICCNKNFMKLMSRGKNDLTEAIELIGYIPSVVIEERKEETTVSNSSDFFQDQTFTMINQLI